MERLDNFLLATNPESSPAEKLREDLEDTLKEYGEFDVIIELIQNALDAIDTRRYISICEAAEQDPHGLPTIHNWNRAILEIINDDYDVYMRAQTAAQKALVYQQWKDNEARRRYWWEKLAGHLGGDADRLREAAETIEGKLRITVRLGPPTVLEIEDNGIGMENIEKCFYHRSSQKRPIQGRPRRYGVRGNHGWGLTAILGFSQRVDVLSKSKGAAPTAIRFLNYRNFITNPAIEPENFKLDVDNETECSQFSTRLRNNIDESGTHVRVFLAETNQTNVLGHTLQNYSRDCFRNFLQIYTPIGQVNDYLLHPAFHTMRKRDIRIELYTITSADQNMDIVDFDIFRFKDRPGFSHYDYDSYINAGWPRGVSVHVVHRHKRGDDVFLSASDVQSADWVHRLEDQLDRSQALPKFLNEQGVEVKDIPRGFQFALSGGMRSEFLARPPRSTTAAFRGVVLSETARPTLGRKYVLDQRTAIPRAVTSHETEYDELRKKLRPTAEPPPATPAAARWRREFHQGVRESLLDQQPLSSDLAIWAGKESLEARAMLVFSELLGRAVFGNFKVLRAHLQDIYDFAFLYRVSIQPDSIPNNEKAQQLIRGGYANREGAEFIRYGIGEFKARGEDILDDMSEDEPRKMADTPDLLVCWSFNEDRVQEGPWTVEASNGEFQGQTHTWSPRMGEVRRERPLPVVALQDLIRQCIEQNMISSAPVPWPDILPQTYY